MKKIRTDILVEDDVLYFMGGDSGSSWYRLRNTVHRVRIELGVENAINTVGSWRWERSMDRWRGRVVVEKDACVKLTVTGLDQQM